MTYDESYRSFRWQLPETFNFAADVVDAWAKDAQKLALLWCDESGREERYTFARISELSRRLGSALRARGLKKGDRCIVMLPRLPQWQIAMVGCLRVGVIPIPCIDMLTAKDVKFRVEHSGAAGAITTRPNVGKFPDLKLRLVVGEDFDAALDTADPDCPPERIAAEDPVAMYYTSGSTGNPKGVTHAARALYAWRFSSQLWHDLKSNDLMWCTADTGWSKAGTAILFGPWSCGAAVLFHRGKFDPAERLRLLAKHRVTVFCAAATEFRRLVNEDLSAYDLSALRLTVSAGETVNPEIVRRWHEKSGVPLLDGYGQTETLMTVLNYPFLPVKPGSMGKPLPGVETAILDGQLAIRLPNPQMMLGYWNEPERTAAGKTRVGDTEYWLTGDMVRQDADGYLFYEGRADDIISSAGYRIGPMEVENALAEHPAVQESAAVGKPDAERGEIVKAFVVLRDGVDGTPQLAAELQEHVKKSTAPYKYPREIEFMAELPKNASGKLLRRVLRGR
ncbi:MAG: AMP-binding protein [Proteobacteria bacterium]|nr:AMP-binding protein [Pseudomonadota bacterium]